MGEIVDFSREKLVIGLLYGANAPLTECLRVLEDQFGPHDYQSPCIDFTFTSYYDRELGRPITRQFIAFSVLVSPGMLADIKTATNAIEQGFAVDGKRSINLDPGLLSLSRFVLASTKPSSHRIPLSRGIYGEVELMFEHGVFRPVEWTYVDYRSPQYLAVLGEIRDLYRKNVKAEGEKGV